LGEDRSVKKTCQRHVFSVGRSGYAARRELLMELARRKKGVKRP